MSAEDGELLVKGSRFDIVRRAMPRRGGGTEPREMMVHPGCVVLLPVLDDGRIVLLQNKRFTVGKTLWELPAGTREPSEPPIACAARELEEETGYQAARLSPLLEFYVAPGVSNERAYAFLAEGLVKTAQKLDATEQIDVHLVTRDEALRMVRANEIEDGKTIATLLFWATR